MSRTYFTEEDIDHDVEWGHVSASQISTARTCLTKAYLSRRTPRTSTPATELGTNVHSLNESWLVKGYARGSELEETISKAMRPHFPAPGHPAAFVEAEINWRPEGWPVPIKGFADLVEPAGTLMADGTVLSTGRISDGKTTANWMYMRTRADLAEDPQGILYDGWAMLAPDGPFQDQDSVEFRHVTAVTKGRDVGTARTVSYEFTRPEVVQKLAQLLPEVEFLKELHSFRWPEDIDKIPFDSTACWKYGRCEFWDICSKYGRTPQSKKTELEDAADELLRLMEKEL